MMSPWVGVWYRLSFTRFVSGGMDPRKQFYSIDDHGHKNSGPRPPFGPAMTGLLTVMVVMHWAPHQHQHLCVGHV